MIQLIETSEDLQEWYMIKKRLRMYDDKLYSDELFKKWAHICLQAIKAATNTKERVKAYSLSCCLDAIVVSETYKDIHPRDVALAHVIQTYKNCASLKELDNLNAELYRLKLACRKNAWYSNAHELKEIREVCNEAYGRLSNPETP